MLIQAQPLAECLMHNLLELTGSDRACATGLLDLERAQEWIVTTKLGSHGKPGVATSGLWSEARTVKLYGAELVMAFFIMTAALYGALTVNRVSFSIFLVLQGTHHYDAPLIAPAPDFAGSPSWTGVRLAGMAFLAFGVNMVDCNSTGFPFMSVLTNLPAIFWRAVPGICSLPSPTAGKGHKASATANTMDAPV